MNFLDQVNAMLQEITDKDINDFEPEEEHNKSEETYLGQINDVNVKKLLVLSRILGKKAEEKAHAAKYDRNRRDIFFVEAQQLKEKSRVLNQLFWVSAQDLLQIWTHSNIGIRKKWMLVSIKGKNLFEVLKAIGETIE